MANQSTAYRQLGDTTLAAFKAMVRGTPLAADAEAIYAAAKGYTRLYLGHAHAENKFDTWNQILSPADHNPIALRPRGYAEESGQHDGYATFDSYVDNVRAWRKRLDDASINTGKTPRNYREAVSLIEYCRVYAPTGDAYGGIVTNSDRYCAELLGIINQLPALETPEGSKPMALPTVVVAAGHRYYIEPGGAPGEYARTPALADAYRDALTEAGYKVIWIQEADGDTDPDDTAGSLDTVSRKLNAMLDSIAGPKVLIDCHYEGGPARGVFAIVPDRGGLGTGAPVPQHPNDTWAGNAQDVALAKALVSNISKATGLPIRTAGVREPGLMSEQQTGVAGQYNARLATFAYTSPHQPDTTRLVVEHGNIINADDQRIIFDEGFTSKLKPAIKAAFASVFGGAAPKPQPAPTGQKIDAVGRATKGAVIRDAASRDGKEVRQYKQRTALKLIEVIKGQLVNGSDLWFKIKSTGPSNGKLIHISGLDPADAEALRKLVK